MTARERKGIVTLLFLFSFLGQALAQVYPVQLDMYIRPPYSTRMTDYTSPGADKLQLRMFLSDATKDMAQVKLQVQVEGPGVTLRTRQGYVPQPFTVEKGIPLMLSGADLAEYFDARNLDITGMPRAQYAAGASLPEGHYRFSIAAIDYYSGLPLSIAGQTNGWLILNDPPMLNFPARAKKVKPEEPQYLTFQWTPRHMGSPNSAFGTEYLFELFEIWPEGARAEDAVRTQTPIYSTVTMQTQLAYTVGETALFRGRRYAWRVTAQPIAGTADFDLFKNGGRSEVYSFRYGDPCLPVEHHEVVKVTDSSVELEWETDNNHTHTVVQYRSTEENRLADDQESWYTIKTEQNSTTIARLQPEMEIEYRLQTYCGSHYTETPESHFVTTDASYKPDFVCGGDPADIKIENQEPLDILMAGDVVMAGDFPVMIDKVKGRGTFTGEGTVGIPFLKQGQLRFTFENIKVNTDYQLIDGHFEAGTDLKSIVGEGKFEVTLEEGEEKNLIKVDAEVADVVISSDGISLMTRDSVPGELARDITDGLKIRGSDGNTTVIAPKGGGEKSGSPVVMTTDVAAATGTSKPSGGGDSGTGTGTTAQPKTDYKYVEFSKSGQKYGFDAFNPEYKKLEQFYRKMNILGKQRTIAWKSFKEGMTDPVKVDTKGMKGISFMTILGDSYKPDKGLLTLRSPAADQVNELYAYTTVGKGKKEKRLILGQLNLVGYAGLSRKVVVIPLKSGDRTAECPTAAEIKTELDKIYAQAGVDWTVEVAQPLDVSGLGVKNDLALEAGGNLIGSAYNGQLQAIINSYREAEKTAFDPDDKEKYYVFLAGSAPDMKNNPSGYMRLQNRFGFVFKDRAQGGDFHRTLAHELGHGAFGLRHPFQEHGLPEDEEHNLMSYGEGKELFKYQWDLVHDPASWVFDVLQGEDEALMRKENAKYNVMVFSPWFGTFIEKAIRENDEDRVVELVEIALQSTFTKKQVNLVKKHFSVLPPYNKVAELNYNYEGQSGLILQYKYCKSALEYDNIKEIEDGIKKCGYLEYGWIFYGDHTTILKKDNYGIFYDPEEFVGQWSYALPVSKITESAPSFKKWSGVTFLFIESGVGGGIGAAVYLGEQLGSAYDEFGKTDYCMRGKAYVVNQKLEDGETPWLVVGAEANFATLGITQDWSSETFVEAVSKEAQISSPAPLPMDFKVALGGALGVNKNAATVGLGLAAGGKISTLPFSVTQSVSVTDAEYDQIKEKAPHMFQKTIGYNLAKFLPKRDFTMIVKNPSDDKLDGEKIQTGDLFIRIGSRTRIKKGPEYSTGFKLFCRYKSYSNEIDNVWMTEEYYRMYKQMLQEKRNYDERN